MKKQCHKYRYFLIILPALFLTGCFTLGKQKVSIKTDWFVKAPESVHYARVSFGPDGRILTSTRKGNVYAIDKNGTPTLLYKGRENPPFPFVSFNPTGNTFGVLADNEFGLFDYTGNRLGVLQGEPGMFKQVPASQLLYSPVVKVLSEEEMFVLKGRIIDATGKTVSTFPAHGLTFSRLTEDYIPVSYTHLTLPTN